MHSHMRVCIHRWGLWTYGNRSLSQLPAPRTTQHQSTIGKRAAPCGSTPELAAPCGSPGLLEGLGGSARPPREPRRDAVTAAQPGRHLSSPPRVRGAHPGTALLQQPQPRGRADGAMPARRGCSTAARGRRHLVSRCVGAPQPGPGGGAAEGTAAAGGGGGGAAQPAAHLSAGRREVRSPAPLPPLEGGALPAAVPAAPQRQRRVPAEDGPAQLLLSSRGRAFSSIAAALGPAPPGAPQRTSSPPTARSPPGPLRSRPPPPPPARPGPVPSAPPAPGRPAPALRAASWLVTRPRQSRRWGRRSGAPYWLLALTVPRSPGSGPALIGSATGPRNPISASTQPPRKMAPNPEQRQGRGRAQAARAHGGARSGCPRLPRRGAWLQAPPTRGLPRCGDCACALGSARASWGRQRRQCARAAAVPPSSCRVFCRSRLWASRARAFAAVGWPSECSRRVP